MPRVKIWIDLDNTPHVPFFAPIIEELERRGHRIVLTARDAFQVCELADEMGISYARIGRHWGGNPIMKIFGLLWRSAQLLPWCIARETGLRPLTRRPRSGTGLRSALRIPTIVADDYECSRYIPVAAPKWIILPDAISDDDLRPEGESRQCAPLPGAQGGRLRPRLQARFIGTRRTWSYRRRHHCDGQDRPRTRPTTEIHKAMSSSRSSCRESARHRASEQCCCQETTGRNRP